MDSELIQQVARLKVRMRQGQQLSLNTQRFFEETEYAKQVLDLAEQADDENIVTMAIALRVRLGLATLPPMTHVAPVAVSAPFADAPQISPAAMKRPDAGRYLRGARS